MLVFQPGWDSDNNNNSPNKLPQNQLDAAIRAAVATLRTRSTDQDFVFLADSVESTSNMLKSYVMKGMHQETGHQIIPETHCTVDVPDFPYRRSYHIWYVWMKIGKTYGWHASKVSYEHAKGQYRSVNL